MALLSRKKKSKAPKALPEREVLPARVPPSAEKLSEFEAQFKANKERSRQRWESGEAIIWKEAHKTTIRQRAETKNAVERGERLINAILSGQPISRRGRKADSAYDKADYHKKISEISGKPLSVSALVELVLRSDKSTEESKVDKMKQALKRRKLR